MASIRKRGEKWQVQVRRKGHAPISRSFIKRVDAREWARHIETQADRQELTADKRILGTILLGDVIKRYRDTVTPRKKAAANETILLNAFLRHSICRKPLSSVSALDFSAYRDERLNKVTARSLKRELSPIHNMFEIAKDEWQLPLSDNPIDRVKLDTVDNKRERRLREGELERLVQAAHTRRNPLILPIILFALETGMRRGEILALQWDQVDLKRRSATILEAKNGYSRTIPLTPKACALLHDVRGNNVRVFPTTANALRLSWDRLTELAGIADLRFHDLRHEAVSRYFEMGLTPPEIASISGHRDSRMLMRYAHANMVTLHSKLSTIMKS